MASIKLFTVEQAERTLPLVRRVVADIVSAYTEHQKTHQERSALGSKINPGSVSEEQAFALERRMHALEAEILRYHEELHEMSVELKDYRTGLIDFYSRYEDRLVFLCWKLDENERLEWWHDLNTGFGGRTPITAANRALFEGHPQPSKANQQQRTQSPK